MNLRHCARYPMLFATLVLALPLALAGCGNKGPLVMAGQPADNEPVPAPAGSVPVEIATPQTLPADATVDPATAAGAAAPAAEPAVESSALDPRIPIDPSTVPGADADSDSTDSTDGTTAPATGTIDDGNG